MNLIKLAAAVAFIAGSAHIAYGADLAPNLTLNTNVITEYKVDAETTTMILEPELGYDLGMTDFTIGTTLTVWDNANSFTLDDEFDHFPTFDFGITYQMQSNLAFEAGTSYDFDAGERGEFSLKATFSF